MKAKVVHATEESLRADLQRLSEQREQWLALEEEWRTLDRLDEEIDATLFLLGEDR